MGRLAANAGWFRAACVVALTLLGTGRARALETDQFTPPPRPLEDLSPQLQQHTTAVLQRVISRTNIRRLDALRATRQTSNKGWKAGHLKRAARYLSEDYVARALFDQVGHGLPECTIETWVAKSTFPYGHYRFDPSMGQSVYGGNPFARPLTLQGLSPTVNVYGTYLGTDKVGHVFQQGYEYFEAYRKAEAKGRTPEQAARAAMQVGVGQEHGFFGLVMVGVYSNADLAANYAGLKFYLNLTRPVTIDGRQRPPILVIRDGLWRINPEAGKDWLRPFFTDHFNEALNPSQYSGQLRGTVRSRFPERAARWVAFYHSDRASEAERLRRLATWHGEDYGHSGIRQVVSVLDMHYDRQAVAEAGAAGAAQPAKHRVQARRSGRGGSAGF